MKRSYKKSIRRCSRDVHSVQVEGMSLVTGMEYQKKNVGYSRISLAISDFMRKKTMLVLLSLYWTEKRLLSMSTIS